jgi:PAS domain-containing protein
MNSTQQFCENSVRRPNSATTTRSDFNTIQKLFERSPDPVCRFDRNLQFTYVNAAGARASNRLPSEFIGKTLRQLGYTEQLSALFEKNLVDVIENNKAVTFTVDFDGPFGLKRYRCRLIPECQNGTVSAVTVFSNEIP